MIVFKFLFRIKGFKYLAKPFFLTNCQISSQALQQIISCNFIAQHTSPKKNAPLIKQKDIFVALLHGF